MIELDLVYTLLLAVLVYFVGQPLTSRGPLLKRFNTPARCEGRARRKLPDGDGDPLKSGATLARLCAALGLARSGR
jgi:hypothetical protein